MKILTPKVNLDFRGLNPLFVYSLFFPLFPHSIVVTYVNFVECVQFYSLLFYVVMG